MKNVYTVCVSRPGKSLMRSVTCSTASLASYYMMYVVEQYKKEHKDVAISAMEGPDGNIDEVRIADKDGKQIAWIFIVEVPVHAKKSDTAKLGMAPILKWLE